MDNLEDFIKIPLYQSTIEDEIFKEVKKEVKDYINENREYFAHAWDCPTLSSIKFPKEKDINSPSLINEIKFHVEQYFKKWNFKDQNFNIKFEKVWINISPHMSYQDVHHHLLESSTNLFSGVLYIDALENSGDLTFTNPLIPYLHLLPKSDKFNDYFRLTPQSQNIIIFPSFLLHLVGTNFSQQERISVSWNVQLIK